MSLKLTNEVAVLRREVEKLRRELDELRREMSAEALDGRYQRKRGRPPNGQQATETI